MPPASFDTIAPIYDPLARLVFGKSIVRAQTHFLNVLPPGTRILVIGGGTGWILIKLLQKQAFSHIDYVEASARMIQMARRQYHRFIKNHPKRYLTQVNFIQGTENDLPPGSSYDAIITFFVLDMYSDSGLQKVADKLNKKLKPHGYWLFADFKLQVKNHRRWWHQGLINMMFVFFRLTCHLPTRRLPDYDRAFSQLNLNKEKTAFFYSHLMVSEVYKKF